MTDPISGLARATPRRRHHLRGPQDQNNKDMFLKLLVAQMRYQDPNNPASTTEFMSQTATFTRWRSSRSWPSRTPKLADAAALAVRRRTRRPLRQLDRENGAEKSGTVTSVRFGGSSPTAVVGARRCPSGSSPRSPSRPRRQPPAPPAPLPTRHRRDPPVLRSMYSAISGLKAHQVKLDVTGNNIANVNTVGFKSSQATFEDTLSQVMRNGSAPTGRRRRHQPRAGRPRRQGRRHHDQLRAGHPADHRPGHRLHDQR